jgi:hypothetical protein
MVTAMRVLRSRFREWWPELIWAAFALAFCFGLRQYAGLAYVVIFSLIFWIMGYRHRTLPLHRKMSRLADAAQGIVTEMQAERAESAADDRGRPHLSLVPRGKKN